MEVLNRLIGPRIRRLECSFLVGIRAAGYNRFFLFDPSHRVWNDAQLALKDAGLMGLCLLLIVVINLDHGPWKDRPLTYRLADPLPIREEIVPDLEISRQLPPTGEPKF